MNANVIKEIIRIGLAEDNAADDITTLATLKKGDRVKAIFRAKQDGVIAGLPIASQVFAALGNGCRFKALVKDGSFVRSGKIIATVNGPARLILSGERLALNLLQRMSGIATLTRRYVDAVKGSGVTILDTRKTAPGLRHLDKYAVRMGGATNHRMTLNDLAMIKDNHIRLAGSITEAVKRVRRKYPKARIEVETANLKQVDEALASKADIIMLDNMTPALMRQAVKQIKGRAKIEASGSISLESIRTVAKTGVDFISIGRLTHSAPALDISMKLV